MNLRDPHGNQAASSRPPVYKHLFSAQSHSVTPTEKLPFIPDKFYPFLDLVFVFRLASMETMYYWQTQCPDKPPSAYWTRANGWPMRSYEARDR
jgi:hypothetical protein